MSNKPAPSCPGCGAEMELTEVSKHTWRYNCEDCGWRSPAVHGPGKEGKDVAYSKAMQRYSENPWISVIDELPAPETRVLASAIDNHGESIVVITEYTHRLYGLGLTGWIEPWQYFSYNYKITHWMPLPEAPKEGE